MRVVLPRCAFQGVDDKSDDAQRAVRSLPRASQATVNLIQGSNGILAPLNLVELPSAEFFVIRNGHFGGIAIQRVPQLPPHFRRQLNNHRLHGLYSLLVTASASETPAPMPTGFRVSRPLRQDSRGSGGTLKCKFYYWYMGFPPPLTCFRSASDRLVSGSNCGFSSAPLWSTIGSPCSRRSICAPVDS